MRVVLISVSGVASRSMPAERGTVRLRLTAEGAEGAAVVARLHDRFAAEARGFVDRGAATRWSAGEVVTAVEQRWDPGVARDARIRVSTAWVEVRFRDLAALGAWLGEVVLEEGVLVDGVDWALTSATRREAEGGVRTAAVRDAVERAEVYAAAAGASGVRLVQLREAGLVPARESHWVAQAKAMSDSRGQAFALHPADVEVQAAVVGDFETTGDAAPPPDAVRARRAARAREQDRAR